jgi:hypothetical protein
MYYIMKQLHSHFKPLPFILLCITGITHCMENQPAPITWAQTYYHLSTFLHPDVIPLIFAFHLDVSGIDYANLPDMIQRSSKNPASFVEYIQTLLKSGNYNFVAELLERGFARAKVSICDTKNEGNWTVLHDASCDMCLETVKIVLHLAGNNTWKLLTTKDTNGETAFHCAAYWGRADTITLLLKAAGNNSWELLATKNNYGWTALHYSACCNKAETVTLLLKAADDNAQELMAIINNQGKTAYDIANLETKKIMEQYPKNNQ